MSVVGLSLLRMTSRTIPANTDVRLRSSRT